MIVDKGRWVQNRWIGRWTNRQMDTHRLTDNSDRKHLSVWVREKAIYLLTYYLSIGSLAPTPRGDMRRIWHYPVHTVVLNQRIIMRLRTFKEQLTHWSNLPRDWERPLPWDVKKSSLQSVGEVLWLDHPGM